ncbi:MAG: 1-acyl-sn-glycerol-3-phosphate acyltransferase [Bacteroidetes bacterium]|nr:1-acyl-sn-glycerol-3-phosphate acyltransferase [Bacteroidota bacterium]MBS1974048.1 1-acyl-sn-glycerol-3-phosphate acyltransferase [Bacteroidota bacterium]
METFFIRIYHYFEKRRAAFWYCFLLSFAFIAYFAAHVHFEEDISKILPKDKKTDKLNQVFQNSKFLDKLVFMVSLKDTNANAQPDSLVAFAESFVPAARRQLAPYIKMLNDKIDDSATMGLLSNITQHLPVYLTEADYKTIDTLISPGRIKEALQNDFKILTSPSGLALKTIISNDPVGISYLGLKKMQQLQYDDNYELYDNYIVTKDHKHLLLFIVPEYAPNNTGKNEKFLQGIDDISDSLTKINFKNIKADYFGATAVSVGNALQLRQDTLLTQGITVFFLIFFIGLYFKKKAAPFIILVPVAYGALFSLAAVYFIKGSISVIALGAGSVVLGVAVNYSLHVFNHYRHTKSIHEVIQDLTMPLTVGSFTTIGGFFCLEFVESDMLKDLGLFAAFSLIGASLCSLIFLPHLMASKKEQKEHVALDASWIDRLARYRPEYNKYLVAIILVLTIVFFYKAQDVSFETDLSNMNYMPAKLKQAQAKLNAINAFSLQSVYLLSEGKNLNEALANNEKLSGKIEALVQKNIVKKYSGVSSLILSDSLQKVRIARWGTYWTNEKKQQLFADLEKEGIPLKFKASAFDNFRSLLNKNYQVADSSVMAGFRESFLADYIIEKPGRSTVVTLIKVAPENKSAVYAAFENDPVTTVLDKQYLTNKFVAIINSDFTSIAFMSSILVFAVLLITYGRIELTLISFVPMFITFIWILGIMSILSIQFNIINIIISALIFGLGDDYSLFIMDGLLQEYKTGRKNLSSFKSSIFLSAITTVAGLGVLIFAKHPALKSIAVISIVGIVCVVIMSQVLIPFLFNILIKNRISKNKFPWTLSGFLKSIFAFSYFVIGTFILTIAGLILTRLNFISKEKGKYFFHVLISKYSKSLMYIMMNVKKTIINPLREDFSKPAVVICNHQSELDILCTAMLHPKLILFTNERVWNSSLSGLLVRMADYFPVNYGAESGFDKIEDRIKQGYSVVVFPEGTRSEDGSIRRFHKGAFYLAEKLGLDILPIMVHGTHYTMAKKDTLLKDGRITIQFLPRIMPNDKTHGEGYAEKAKYIGRYFRAEFEKLRARAEQPAYFSEKLLYNYIYKGPVLEWYMRIKTKMECNYQLFHELLPKKGKILDAGCGYGFMSYMLQFSSNDRLIKGIDYDEEKIETAGHCFSRNEKISFSREDITKFRFEKYDGIVMADVLHYLQPAQQKEVIENCIQSLNENGILVIRDGNTEMAERHKKTKKTEFYSTKFFGFNRTTESGLSYLSASFIRNISVEQKTGYREIDPGDKTSNIFFIITKNPANVHATV